MLKTLSLMIIFTIFTSASAFGDNKPKLLVGIINNDDNVCNLFIDKNGHYVSKPKGIFKKEYIHSKTIEFDANNDGIIDLLVPKEEYMRPIRNRVYYAFKGSASPDVESSNKLQQTADFIVPESWMNCPNSLANCVFNPSNKLKLPEADLGRMNIGIVPGAPHHEEQWMTGYSSAYSYVQPFFVDGVTYFQITSLEHAIESVVTFGDDGVSLKCAFRSW